MPGVRRAALNRSIARVVVTVDAGGPSTAELCRIVADAERRTVAPGARRRRQACRATTRSWRPVLLWGRLAPLPGLGSALTGSAPPQPRIAQAPLGGADVGGLHVPVCAARSNNASGPRGPISVRHAELRNTAALTVSPASAAAEAATRAMLAVEAWHGRLAGRWHEPELAATFCADDAGRHVNARASPTGRVTAMPIERAAVGLGAAALLGTLSRNLNTAGAAALVAVPKPFSWRQPGGLPAAACQFAVLPPGMTCWCMRPACVAHPRPGRRCPDRSAGPLHRRAHGQPGAGS